VSVAIAVADVITLNFCHCKHSLRGHFHRRIMQPILAGDTCLCCVAIAGSLTADYAINFGKVNTIHAAAYFNS
jgi:hypothetical protein